MKIAACDFDGTLYRDGEVTYTDLAAIKNWRKAGNVFGIVTGRGRDTILRDVTRFSVPYDFLICNNGAMICDAQSQTRYVASLPQEIRPILAIHPGIQASSQCVFFAGTAQFAHSDKVPYWVLKEYELPRLTLLDALALPKLHQVSVAYAESDVFERWAELFLESCGEYAEVHINTVSIDITAPNIDKASGIEQLLQLECWDDFTDIFVIGDDKNDLPMIRHFSGYSVSNASLDIQKYSSQVFRCVGEMLHESL